MTAMSPEAPALGHAARLESIDLVRGAIMVLMALDHTRDFFGIPGQNPTNLATASAALFFTRWVTHFCAPGFFLLMGTGACLAGRRRTREGLSRFLVARGAWLILLDLVVLRCFAYQFNVDYRVTMLLVLWALGWALIALAGLVWLPIKAIAALGVVMVAGHNLLDGMGSSNPLWVILHRPGLVFNVAGHIVFAAYTLIPWIGVTALGYAVGAIYTSSAGRRQAFLLRTGMALTLAFVVVRAANTYGDPAPWTHQKTALFTCLSFLNTTKYPPSLAFLLMTIGPVLLALAWAESRPAAWPRVLLVFGRVPLFYYMLHFALLHAFATLVCAWQYGAIHWMFESPDLARYPFTPPPGWGFGLPLVYVVWACLVIATYPLCRWFAAVKSRRHEPWLSYL
jgi:uncharacterized membrane protein